MLTQFQSKSKHAFTLVELLIVIGILAVLATATVLILNPAQFLAQSRDSVRISDIDTLDKSIALYQTNGGDFVPANIVYISLPDDAPVDETGHNNCPTIHAIVPDPLPILPSGWSYRCATQANLRSITGDGWIPLDLTSAPPSSLATLPVDPINSYEGQRYYTYIGGSWNLTASMESTKFLQSTNLSDGGNDPSRYEAGSNLALWNEPSGLVGYWSMDEGSGTVTADKSGNNYNGDIRPSGSGPTPGSAGQVGGSFAFDGSDDRVNIPDVNQFEFDSFAISAWVKTYTLSATKIILAKYGGSVAERDWRIGMSSGSKPFFGVYDSSGASTFQIFGPTSFSTSTWTHIAGVRSGSIITLYVNGVVARSLISAPSAHNNVNQQVVIGAQDWGLSGWWNGLIDEVRIYSRALSDTEISAIYNATK